eukprot:3556275-Pleurochrysis_carterae.AAC.3
MTTFNLAAPCPHTLDSTNLSLPKSCTPPFVRRRLSHRENIATMLAVMLMMRSVTGYLLFTLVAIRDVPGGCRNREICRNIELDKPQGRAFLVKSSSDAKGDSDKDKAAPTRERGPRGDPSRHARDRKPNEHTGACSKGFVRMVSPLRGLKLVSRLPQTSRVCHQERQGQGTTACARQTSSTQAPPKTTRWTTPSAACSSPPTPSFAPSTWGSPSACAILTTIAMTIARSAQSRWPNKTSSN